MEIEYWGLGKTGYNWHIEFIPNSLFLSINNIFPTKGGERFRGLGNRFLLRLYWGGPYFLRVGLI